MNAATRVAVSLGLIGAMLVGCGGPIEDSRVPPPPLPQAKVLAQASEAVVQLRMTKGRNDKSSGTGFIIDPERGEVLTAAHNVNGATRIIVTLHDGTRVPATVLGNAASRDIALVQLVNPPDDLTSVPLSTGGPPAPNSDAVTLNYGTNAERTGSRSLNTSRVTVSVSETTGLQAGSDMAIYASVMQLSGDNRPGGSGGAVIDPRTGAVEAMLVAGHTENTVGYGIPARTLRRELRALKEGIRKTDTGLAAMNVREVDLTPIYAVYWSPLVAADLAEQFQKFLRKYDMDGLLVSSAAATKGDQ
jgi:S1-C subfamily serine protease